MPDITMCGATNCSKKHKCYRHAASGTKPDNVRQSYALFEEDQSGYCPNFWNVKDRQRA